MPCFAIVRSTDLAPIRRELSQILRFRHRGLRRADTLLGIWIDSQALLDTPRIPAPFTSAAADAPLVVHEVVSMSDRWTLYWLEPPDEGSDKRAVRRTLLAMLTATSDGRATAFVPTFRLGTDRTAIDREMSALHRQFPEHLERPWYQDHTTRELTPNRPERTHLGRVSH